MYRTLMWTTSANGRVRLWRISRAAAVMGDDWPGSTATAEKLEEAFEENVLLCNTIPAAL